MCSFVKILSIERQPKAYSDTRSEFDIVSESSNAPVIQLSLILQDKLSDSFIRWVE